MPKFDKNTVIVAAITTLGVLFLINRTPVGKPILSVVGPKA